MDYYTPTGRPIAGALEWATLFEGEFRQYTHLDTKVGPLRVSTIWLGLDHSFQSYAEILGEPTPPILIFETMVFAWKTSGGHDLYADRYSTIEQAVAGHWRTVRWARKRWPLLWYRAWRYQRGRDATT